MSRPTLSICVITYNRATLLQQTLAHLACVKTWPFECEVIVSDNCSTDDTAAVVAGAQKEFAQVRYVQQARNVGMDNNFIAAFRMATGDYALYLADDDRLIPDAVVSLVQYMERTPRLAACYAPQEGWDDVTKKSLYLDFHVGEAKVFGKNESLEVFNYLIQRRIFPEIAIYRTNALHKSLYPTRRLYWAFVALARLLECGEIAFVPSPFYRYVERSADGASIEHQGDAGIISGLDLFRGGLEYFLLRAYRNLGYPAVPQDQRDTARKMIDSFVFSRLGVAVRKMAYVYKDFIGAHATLARMLYSCVNSVGELPEYRHEISVKATVQAVVGTFDACTSLTRLLLYRVSDASSVMRLLHEIRHDLPVYLLPDDSVKSLADKQTVLILAGSDGDRQTLLAAGYPEGYIILEPELLARFAL